MAVSKGSGVIGAGSAALRKVLSNPLLHLKRDEKSAANRRTNEGGALSGDSVNAIIEGEIIPRLLLAHASGGHFAAKGQDPKIHPSDANKFSTMPLRLEAANLLEEVDKFLAEGVSVNEIYLDLLAPAARKLGEMWDNDECDFIDVTMGLWRLQEVMRDIAQRSSSRPVYADASACRVLFSPMPGDQHSFGSLMIDEVFARAGWQSSVLSKPQRRELLEVLSRQPYDVVGLTLMRECPSSAIANLIKAMRNVSSNPHISILIGGNMINQNPGIVAEVGADGTGADARAALEVAQRLVDRAPVRAHMVR